VATDNRRDQEGPAPPLRDSLVAILPLGYSAPIVLRLKLSTMARTERRPMVLRTNASAKVRVLIGDPGLMRSGRQRGSGPNGC